MTAGGRTEATVDPSELQGGCLEALERDALVCDVRALSPSHPLVASATVQSSARDESEERPNARGVGGRTFTTAVRSNVGGGPFGWVVSVDGEIGAAPSENS